jgi:hypothetical protein
MRTIHVKEQYNLTARQINPRRTVHQEFHEKANFNPRISRIF